MCVCVNDLTADSTGGHGMGGKEVTVAITLEKSELCKNEICA